MAPKGLKIGDIFEEEGKFGPIKNRVIGFDGQGNYVAEMVTEETVPVEDFIQEELPFTIPDDEIDEVQPVVEEEKKPAPKKTTTRKKTTAKKTSKK